MAGIKELSELIDGMKVLLVDAKKVLKDGKVDLQDLPVALDLLNQVSVLVEAAKGLDLALAEAKDLDATEAVALVEKLYAVVKDVQAA